MPSCYFNLSHYKYLVGNGHSSFFKGPPGTGKTTSVLALAHELLGANYREAVLELNASDDRSKKCLSFFSTGLLSQFLVFVVPC